MIMQAIHCSNQPAPALAMIYVSNPMVGATVSAHEIAIAIPCMHDFLRRTRILLVIYFFGRQNKKICYTPHTDGRRLPVSMALISACCIARFLVDWDCGDRLQRIQFKCRAKNRMNLNCRSVNENTLHNARMGSKEELSNKEKVVQLFTFYRSCSLF